MKNAPIIDLSLRAPRELIAERGGIVGPVLVAWFRLMRPALVGGVWASICIYTYRYLLPFNEAEMPIEQIVFYVTSIALIAGTIVMWLIAGRVVHPLAYRWRVSKMLRRSASVKVRSVPTALAGARRRGARRTTRILVASHDANGSISGIEWVAHAGPQHRE
ncbi:Biofilm PGA synthesis auxiliary protein PgaD [Burkholderia sp. Tr-862]|uniref:Biofilm PGA synthesis auxiliary protein PgaD n=1 Tax=Burkholderia TaxID=32008 RepID=UPI00141A1FB0|nr:MULTISPECIES: Biofilm PGA synthesis auxiliary protein PgaD [unclassified Burkholderia]NIF42186.1 Biofilm PGA synthesis auxiliary protein PgaD [Burkholderia sp. Tr-862]UEP32209.1 Biofilm PGA synthesis auxiliary protein PgaD [Burkholderia sp. B21-007]UEP45204.1 Biofilm PGA synthesis auxiliary protein PgaD [Burkholderia sp. B21-005]